MWGLLRCAFTEQFASSANCKLLCYKSGGKTHDDSNYSLPDYIAGPKIDHKEKINLTKIVDPINSEVPIVCIIGEDKPGGKNTENADRVKIVMEAAECAIGQWHLISVLNERAAAAGVSKEIGHTETEQESAQMGRHAPVVFMQRNHGFHTQHSVLFRSAADPKKMLVIQFPILDVSIESQRAVCWNQLHVMHSVCSELADTINRLLNIDRTRSAKAQKSADGGGGDAKDKQTGNDQTKDGSNKPSGSGGGGGGSSGGGGGGSKFVRTPHRGRQAPMSGNGKTRKPLAEVIGFKQHTPQAVRTAKLAVAKSGVNSIRSEFAKLLVSTVPEGGGDENLAPIQHPLL